MLTSQTYHDNHENVRFHVSIAGVLFDLCWALPGYPILRTARVRSQILGWVGGVAASQSNKHTNKRSSVTIHQYLLNQTQSDSVLSKMAIFPETKEGNMHSSNESTRVGHSTSPTYNV